MGDQTKQRAVYEFLREGARSGATFKTRDLNDKMGWTGQTASTYRSKHFDAYLEKVAHGVYRVIPEFRRVTWDEFQDLVTQVRRPFASYNRATYQAVVVYDFLMPLTREDKLRKALDELFYRDTLERRIMEVGLDVMARTIPRQLGDSDDEYMARIISFIDERIGGFSISHVSGRFRTGPIVSRPQSAELLVRDEAYLIDETTAVVRFIIPCVSSKLTHGGDFDLNDPREDRSEVIKLEVQRIRAVFFELFVEALVPTIRGEKLIWMLETTPTGRRLYELDLVKPRPRGGARSADEVEYEDDDAGSDETPDDAT
jgi:hypothetical protein